MTKGAKFGAVDFADDGGAFTYEGIEGQIQGNIDVAFPGGVRVGAAVNFGARPDGRFHFVDGKLNVSAPLN